MARTLIVLLSLLLSGCLERRETVTVEPDGTVLIEADFEASSAGELHEGDAVPTPAGDWLVEEWVEQDEDGQQRYHLRAEARFGPAQPLPDHYAAPDDPRGDECLQFPTTVTIEQRPDGLYYHFRRVYPERAWAPAEALRRQLLEERLQDLQGKEIEELSAAERAVVADAFADFTVARMLAFAREPFLELTPDVPQDRWLAVVADMRQARQLIDLRRLDEILAIEDRRQRDEALEAEVRLFEDRTFDRLTTALREHCGYQGRLHGRFVALYDKRRRTHEVTADLGDDAFEITVALPGQIVGSNADSVFGSTARWRFGGKRFRDRPMELLASSRLPWEQVAGQRN